MNCRQAEEMIQLRLDGGLNESGCELLDAHIGECQACARLYEEIRSLENWARELEPAAPPPSFADRVMARLGEPERAPALDESISIGLPLALTALLAAVALPVLVMTARTLWGWYGLLAADAGGFATATAADLSEVSRDASDLIGPLWSAAAQAPALLPGEWLTIAILAASLAVFAFNYLQTRAESVRV